MVKIRPKSSELVQAQIASFVAERVEGYRDKAYLMGDIGDLSVGDVADVIRITGKPEYLMGEDGNRSLRVVEGVEVPVATGAEYVEYLRLVGGMRHEGIKIREEIISEYYNFEPVVAQLQRELGQRYRGEEHAGFLGDGCSSDVFMIKKDDKPYAVRVPRHAASNITIDRHIAGAVLGRGIPHLEQIVAASYEYGVTVAEVMPGKELPNLTVDEIKGVTDAQLKDFVDTIVEANRRGIGIDPKPSNIFYDPKEGYGIVDYHSAKDKEQYSATQYVGDITGWLATSIDIAGLYGKKQHNIKTASDYADSLEFMQANLDVLQRYRTVVGQKLKGIERKKSLALIDERLTLATENVRKYSDPEWVARRAQEEKRLLSKRSEGANSVWSSADNWVS